MERAIEEIAQQRGDQFDPRIGGSLRVGPRAHGDGRRGGRIYHRASLSRAVRPLPSLFARLQRGESPCHLRTPTRFPR